MKVICNAFVFGPYLFYTNPIVLIEQSFYSLRVDNEGIIDFAEFTLNPGFVVEMGKRFSTGNYFPADGGIKQVLISKCRDGRGTPNEPTRVLKS